MAIPTFSYFLETFGNIFLFLKYFFFIFLLFFLNSVTLKYESNEVSAQTDVRFSGYGHKEMF